MVICKVNPIHFDSIPKKFDLKFLNFFIFYFSSSIVRDLTLRSAPSFGSFHLIRLLFDEYFYYLIEHKIADKCGLVPLAVMCKVDLNQETS
jgi:hypothetical protein